MLIGGDGMEKRKGKKKTPQNGTQRCIVGVLEEFLLAKNSVPVPAAQASGPPWDGWH